GINSGHEGESDYGTACNSEDYYDTYLPEYPGLSVVYSPSSRSFNEIASTEDFETIQIIHELCHQFGALDLTGADICGVNCTNFTDCSIMCDHACDKLVFDYCSINKISNHFLYNCEDCYESFTDYEECLHCMTTTKITALGDFPMVPNCSGGNLDEFTMECTFINDCDPLNARLILAYRSDQVVLLDLGGFTTTHD